MSPLPIILIATLSLAACGSAGEPDAGSISEVTTSTETDGLMAPRPIEVTSSGGSGGAAAMSAESDRVATDMMMPAYDVDYVVGDAMPPLPTDSTGYLFDAAATWTPESIAALAAALGVVGEPVRLSDDYTQGWRIGPEDGSAPVLWMYDDATLSWSYNAPYSGDVAMGGCSVSGSPGSAAVTEMVPYATDSDATTLDVEARPGAAEATIDDVAPVEPTVDEMPPVEPTVDDMPPVESATDDSTVERNPGPEVTCAEPEPPTGVPTGDEAETRAREVVTAFGESPDAFTFETYADDWFASVSAVQQIDGVTAGPRWDFGFGAAGVLQYAGGQVATPQPVGPYPLIDLDAAVARLDEQSGWFGGVRGGVALETAVADVADVAADPEPNATDAPAPEPMPTDISTDAPPPEPQPIEPMTVTLVDVQHDLWWVWDVDGSVWLLPAYRFIDTDGGWHVVPAVTDEFLVQVDPPVDTVTVDPPVETVPPETVPPETVPVESVPPATDPGDAPVESTPPSGGSTPDTTAPTPDPASARELEALAGLTVAEFTEQAKALGYTTRVVEQDGESLAVTDDYSTSRVNIAVDGEIVVAIRSLG